MKIMKKELGVTRMKRKLQMILSAACISAVLCSCAGQTQQAEKPSGSPQTKKEEENGRQGNLNVLNPSAYGDVSGIRLEPGAYLSIIGKENGSEFWNEVKAGAQQAGADLNAALGYKGEDKIKVNYSGPSKGENIEEQINILDEELARNPAAVAIAMIDSTACDVQFDLASENGTPIVAFDSGSSHQDIQAMCATNNHEVGKTAAMKLAAIMENRGEVAVFVHDRESTTGQERQEAFLKELQENHPDMKAPLVYHLDDLEETAKMIAAEKTEASEESSEGTEDILQSVTQTEAIRYLLEKNPNIKGCYATNIYATQELLTALDDMDKDDMTIIGTDGGKEQMKALEEGKISGLIVQNPYGMGYAAVVASARAALDMGNQNFVDSSFIWLTKDNMDKKEIKRMLY